MGINGNMQKSKIVKGYIAYHKEVPYGVWNSDIWTPIQANTEKNGKITTYGGVYDNEGEDNISAWNLLFAETTCLYWIWKNHPKDCKYVAFTQYRRRFDIHSEEELDKIFTQYRVIAARPLPLSVKTQYCKCHNAGDLEWIKEIIHRLYPEYDESWDKYIENGRLLFYSNGAAFRKDEYDKYCEWLFSILFEYKRLKRFETVEDVKKFVQEQIDSGLRPNADSNGKRDNALNYQSQICGFLSERLYTLYLLHNYKWEDIAILPYYKLEKCL